MSITSRLITVQLPDKEGNLVPFYTYDGYLEEPQRHQLRAARRNYSLAKVSGAAIFAFAAFIATRKLSLPSLCFKGCSVPTAGLFSCVVGGAVGWTLTQLYGCSRLSNLKRDLVLNGQSVPLWSNLRYAVNPDRAFFQLADERNNQPLIFHSGLTPEAAARMIPDKVIGGAPSKPHYPTAHGHDHH